MTDKPADRLLKTEVLDGLAGDVQEVRRTLQIALGDLRVLQDALDDLWGCIGLKEIEDLQPETILVARANHRALCHPEQPDEAASAPVDEESGHA